MNITPQDAIRLIVRIYAEKKNLNPEMVYSIVIKQFLKARKDWLDEAFKQHLPDNMWRAMLVNPISILPYLNKVGYSVIMRDVATEEDSSTLILCLKRRGKTLEKWHFSMDLKHITAPEKN